MNTYKKYFREMSPEKSVCAQALSVKAKARREKSRRLRVRTAAAAAFMICTVTATAAAADRDIFSIASRWLGLSPAETVQNAVNISRTTVNTDTFENIDLVPRSVFTDGSMNILFIDITRTDGGVFDCAPYTETFTDGTPHMNVKTGEPYVITPVFDFKNLNAVAFYYNEDRSDVEEQTFVPCRIFLTEDSDPLDSTLTLALFLDGTDMRYDRETVLSLYLGTLYSTKHTLRQDENNTLWLESRETEHMEGIWQGSVYFTPVQCERLYAAPGSVSEFTAYPRDLDENGRMPEIKVPFTVDEISVSRMTASFRLHAARPEKMLFLNTLDIGEIYLDDGSVIPVNADYTHPFTCNESGNIPAVDDSEYWTCDLSVMLTSPIDINRVTAVRFGSETFGFTE
ncbi:MAG: hypothetical protein NC078_08720 [Ruminococcus sp.]|nr:hypothetical protein [Ruminococcus sp.]